MRMSTTSTAIERSVDNNGDRSTTLATTIDGDFVYDGSTTATPPTTACPTSRSHTRRSPRQAATQSTPTGGRGQQRRRLRRWTTTTIDDAGGQQRRRIHGLEKRQEMAMVRANDDPVSDLGLLQGDDHRQRQTSHTAYYDTCGYSAYERGSSMMDTYQWYRSGTAITGATCDAYTLTNDDATQTIQVSMTYADTAGRQTTVLSAASAIVTDVDNNDRPPRPYPTRLSWRTPRRRSTSPGISRTMTRMPFYHTPSPVPRATNNGDGT